MKTIALLLILLATAVSGQVIHVPAQYSTIQQAVDIAQPGDTVLVADGIYYEQVKVWEKFPLTIASHFILDNDSVHLYNTIIDGEKIRPAKRKSVVILHGVDSTTVIAGFTIRNGQGTMDDVTGTMFGGGVMLDSSGGKIIHNIITGNNVYAGGASIVLAAGAGIGSVASTGTWVVIEENAIFNNTCCSCIGGALGAGGYVTENVRLVKNVIRDNICNAYHHAVAKGGGFFASGGSLVASDNKVHCNYIQSQIQAEGGGILSYAANNIIQNNEFTYNESISPESLGGAVAVRYATQGSYINDNLFSLNYSKTGAALGLMLGNDSVTISRNKFVQNEAETGGAVYLLNALAQVENNVFKDNYATEKGGGMFITRWVTPITTSIPSCNLVNNTFRFNRADETGGAVVSVDANPAMLNNIFWCNKSIKNPDISNISGTMWVAYTTINTTEVVGNVDFFEGILGRDPMFNDSNCCICWQSPCVNAGTDSYIFPGGYEVVAPGIDVNATLRPIDVFFDQGAFEASPFSVTPVKDIFEEDFTVYPNPVRDIITVRLRTAKQHSFHMEVLSLAGQICQSANVAMDGNEGEINIELINLEKGVYILRMVSPEVILTKKILKQ